MRYLILGAVLWCGWPLLAADPRPMTPHDLWNVKRVGAPSLSPDGQWAAVEVTEYDLQSSSNEPKSQIWLLSTDGKVQKQLTTAPGRNSFPKWSPDGLSIAFVSKRGADEVPQIYVISPRGGEAKRVSNLPFAPSALKWSGDSSTIYFIASTWPDTVDDAAYKKREQERKEARSKAVVIDDALFRYWDRWLTDGKKPYVFALDVVKGTHRNLLAGTGHHLPVTQPSESHYDVSPDGRELCYVVDNVPALGMDVNLDLFTLDISPASGETARKPKLLTGDNPANDSDPVYSPDGKTIAFLRQTIKFFYADRTRIMLHDRTAATHRELTANLDRPCANPRWLADGKTLAAEIEDAGYVRLGLVDVGSGRVTMLRAAATVRSMEFARQAPIGVMVQSSFSQPPTVVAFRPGSDEWTRLERWNEPLVSQWKLGKVEERTFRGADDRDVQLFIVYPPDFDPQKKWPLVQMVHGGPHNAFHNDFSFRWNPQVWAARGWVIAIVNFHGSSSFGQEFTDSITGDLGTKPMIDIMKSTDWLEQQPWIDKQRIAAAGASYGGYMMAWLNGHTDRFRAMVCHAGVYNWHSMMASDVVRSRERSLGAPPWDNHERVDRQNAQRFSKNFKTPTLVLHGELDYRVPITQGLEYYNTLKQKGVPTRFVYFPDENHWVLKPHNSLVWHREVFSWLEKFIGNGPDQSPRSE
jgi:dipeptidyl aminopeptidase/acylaminoacyl peptidase